MANLNCRPLYLCERLCICLLTSRRYRHCIIIIIINNMRMTEYNCEHITAHNSYDDLHFYPVFSVIYPIHGSAVVQWRVDIKH